MKTTSMTLVVLFTLLSAANADDNWKNWYAITWRDTSANIVRYTNQMGYDYIGVRDFDFNKYKNNPDCRGKNSML